jgi:hypothetical protein
LIVAFRYVDARGTDPNLYRCVTAAPPKKKNPDRLGLIAERYRNHPAIRQFLLRISAVLVASLLMGVLVLM